MSPLLVDLIAIPARSNDIPCPRRYPIPGGEDGRSRIHALRAGRGGRWRGS
jgi:hypothetical protein